MRAEKIFLLMIIFFAYLNIANAIEYADFNKTYYNDLCFRDINQYPYGDLRTFVFASTRYLNETRYFLINVRHESGNGTNFYIARRYDSFCNLEDARIIASTGGCTGDYVPQIGNTYFWDGTDEFLIPIYDSCGGRVELLRFNITDYINAAGGQWVYDYSNPLLTSAPVGDANRLSIGSIMSKGYYTDMVATLSFPIVMATSNKIKVCYDFYDLENHVATPSNMKCIETGGAENITRVYVIPTNGYCFQWSNCLFHIIYEGKSSQNNYRYGIYAREIRKGFFGYEYSDRGFIPLTSDMVGFVNDYIVGIKNWWYYPANYPELTHRIYAFILSPDGRRMVVALTFDIPSYYIINEQVINYHDNNALVNYARDLLEATSPTLTWINGTRLYRKFYLGGYVHAAAILYTSCTASLSVKLYDYYNGTLIGSAGCSAYVPASATSASTFSPCFSIVNLPENISLYNISVSFNFTTGGCLWARTRVYHDIIGSNSTLAVTIAPNGVETFLVHPYSEYPLTDFKFALQFPTEATCICTEWTYRGCYNATHDYWTRSCVPVKCSDEIKFGINETCIGLLPTTTTTIGPAPIPGAPPGAGYTGGLFNLTGIAYELNLTGGALVGIAILDRILSLSGIATIITISVAGLLGYLTRSSQVVAVSVLLMVLFFTLIGFYPWWFGLIFIIIAGFIITIIFREAF